MAEDNSYSWLCNQEVLWQILNLIYANSRAQAGLFNDRVSLYRHTYNALTEEVYRYLLGTPVINKFLYTLKVSWFLRGTLSPLDYLPVRPAGVLGNTSPDFSINEQHQALFDKNLRKLSELYPEIANFYNNYKPQRSCQDQSGLDNIYHLPSKTFAYHDCNKQSAQLAELFIENPYRETAIYSQTFQEKLAKYIDFKKSMKWKGFRVSYLNQINWSLTKSEA